MAIGSIITFSVVSFVDVLLFGVMLPQAVRQTATNRVIAIFFITDDAI